ncbi:hypothetical protein AVEN_54735-1 [Araneus ventricosus]|uniref:Uncharacterized protein n=1 Tax=Araneus ventricosus TaxID=182803 RepID=A0A4Y2FBY3_ARAVE|nr:hypothetical protein AVEN_54735-1 [Araneus ventricosus]
MRYGRRQTLVTRWTTGRRLVIVTDDEELNAVTNQSSPTTCLDDIFHQSSKRDSLCQTTRQAFERAIATALHSDITHVSHLTLKFSEGDPQVRREPDSVEPLLRLKKWFRALHRCNRWTIVPRDRRASRHYERVDALKSN